MAVHASLGRRNSGETRGLNRRVAVAAIDTKSSDVVLVAEGDGLRLAHAGVGNVGRALNLHPHPAQGCDYKDRAKDSGARQCIRTAMKDLRHSLMRLGLRDPADGPRLLDSNVRYGRKRKRYTEKENHRPIF